MKPYSLARLLPAAVLVLIAGFAPYARGTVTIWTGDSVTFTQPPAANPMLAANQDRLTPYVWLTRDVNDRMFNARYETFCNRGLSPTNTAWASGTLEDDVESLEYTDFSTWVDDLGPGHVYQKLPDTPAICRMSSNNVDFIYFAITFNAWAHDGVGGYSYSRSTPAGATAPSVTITSPTNGTVLAAPANLKFDVTASAAVTNVAFFVSGSFVTSDQSSPFSINLGNLPTNAYTLTAVATATGLSTTSTPVNITVVAPVVVTLSAPKFSNNAFTFDYTANAGLRYVIQNSSNLVNWLPLVTNVAGSSPVHFTNNPAPNGPRYYRVGRLPNP